MIKIPNFKVACEPFESLALQKQGVHFVTAKQKNSLFMTRVVYPNINVGIGAQADATNIIAGTLVLIRGDAMTLGWTREVFLVGGKKVILVPIDQIQALASPDEEERLCQDDKITPEMRARFGGTDKPEPKV